MASVAYLLFLLSPIPIGFEFGFGSNLLLRIILEKYPVIRLSTIQKAHGIGIGIGVASTILTYAILQKSLQQTSDTKKKEVYKTNAVLCGMACFGVTSFCVGGYWVLK